MSNWPGVSGWVEDWLAFKVWRRSLYFYTRPYYRLFMQKAATLALSFPASELKWNGKNRRIDPGPPQNVLSWRRIYCNVVSAESHIYSLWPVRQVKAIRGKGLEPRQESSVVLCQIRTPARYVFFCENSNLTLVWHKRCSEFLKGKKKKRFFFLSPLRASCYYSASGAEQSEMSVLCLWDLTQNIMSTHKHTHGETGSGISMRQRNRKTRQAECEQDQSAAVWEVEIGFKHV